jgi:uncharacterized membrane protein YccC
MDTSAASPRWGGNLTDALTAAGAPLLFGIRMWASVCLALFVAFSLDLDNPFWAGASAAIVCQPQLGASLRKGWFRMIGTVVGATMVVVLTALFPQDRIAFLGLLAVWGGICAFVATVLRNFASYAAALAGYTAAIIAADTLGATGGPGPDVFLLAVWRTSEICIGIACAGIVLAGTDLGGAQRRLATSLANLAAEIAGRMARMLELAGPQLPDTQTERRELVRRVIALDPLIDQTLGESNHVRYHATTLQTAVHGLFRTLDGWRGVATHLSQSPPEMVRQAVQAILRGIPPELRAAWNQDAPTRWIGDPVPLQHLSAQAVRRLVALPAGTPSLRLLADETAKAVAGMVHALDGLALLVDIPGRSPPHRRGFELAVPDWLPALINAARAFATIGAVEIFWVITAWPNGGSAMVFTMAVVLLLGPRGDLAYGGAIAIALGTTGSIIGAATIKFAVLPALETFPAFCIAFGLFLVPVGFAIARSGQPAVAAIFTAMAFNFVPLLAPTNQMSYDTAQFYNSALATLSGCVVAALTFGLWPPLSPVQRARRLLALTLRDLRRLAIAPVPPRAGDWESRMYGRFAAVPDQAEPLQRARLLAALSVGAEIIHLRRTVPRLGPTAELEAALTAFASGNGAVALAWLRQLDRRLASASDAGPAAVTAVRARSRILVMSEALSTHSPYFDTGATA